MAFDYLGMLRSDTADLTEDEKGTGINIGTSGVMGLNFLAIVEQATGTSPSLEIDIQGANTDADGSYVTVGKFPPISAAGQYSHSCVVPYTYIRAYLHDSSVTAAEYDYGKVLVGIVPALDRFWAM